MLIILEGIDGSGKTTMMADLAARGQAMKLEVQTLHQSQPRGSDGLAIYEWPLTYGDLARRVWSETDLVIMDRWHVGELIYGPLYRGRSILSYADTVHLELFLRSRGALKIHVTAPLNEITRRLAEDGEDFLKPEDQQTVYDFYHDHARKFGWRTAHATRHKASHGELIDHAKDNTYEAQRTRRYTTYIGSSRPAVLFVLPPEETYHPSYPSAAVPRPGSDGEILLTALGELGQSYAYGVAASDENLLALWEVLDHPVLVTLGSEALVAASDYGLEPDAGHALPQHAKEDPFAYGQEIKKMIGYAL